MNGLGLARTRALAATITLLAAAIVATGCGGSADDASASGVPVLGFMTARDQTGLDDELFRECERASGGAYRINAIPMGPTVDDMRDQMARRLAAGDTSIDMMSLDVTWSAEFSDARWLVDLTERIEPIKDRFVPAALRTTYYKNKYWAMPSGTNAALLYYRTDLVDRAPTTWEELADMAEEAQRANPGTEGFVFQGKAYEGGTVNALEFMMGAGTTVLSEDGDTVGIGADGSASAALTWLQSIRERDITPRAVTTFMEEDARMAFQNGSAVFMRNWPYAAPLMEQDPSSEVRGKFAVAQLPAFEGHEPVSVLGGQNFGIANSSKHPELAWQAIECLTSASVLRRKAIEKGEMPGLLSLYDDAELKQAIPHLEAVERGLAIGTTRPITPYYSDVTLALSRTYNDVLNGNLDPDDAVEQLQRSVQAAVDGRAEI